MDRLDDHERAVVACATACEGEPLTLTEIGRRLGITREWVRKIELRALGKLGDAPAGVRRASAAGRCGEMPAVRAWRCGLQSDQSQTLGSGMA